MKFWGFRLGKVALEHESSFDRLKAASIVHEADPSYYQNNEFTKLRRILPTIVETIPNPRPTHDAAGRTSLSHRPFLVARENPLS